MANVSNFYKRLRDLCEERNMTINEVVKLLGLSSGSPTAWKSGVTPRPSTVQKIADLFQVSVDYLLGSTVDYKGRNENAPTLTEKDERDIARDLERIMSQLGSSGDLMFDGDPMSDEARESMLAAMELGLRAAKLKNKARFTPKKHRKG